jgi:hypothetical protein
MSDQKSAKSQGLERTTQSHSSYENTECLLTVELKDEFEKEEKKNCDADLNRDEAKKKYDIAFKNVCEAQKKSTEADQTFSEAKKKYDMAFVNVCEAQKKSTEANQTFSEAQKNAKDALREYKLMIHICDECYFRIENLKRRVSQKMKEENQEMEEKIQKMEE